MSQLVECPCSVDIGLNSLLTQGTFRDYYLHKHGLYDGVRYNTQAWAQTHIYLVIVGLTLNRPYYCTIQLHNQNWSYVAVVISCCKL